MQVVIIMSNSYYIAGVGIDIVEISFIIDLIKKKPNYINEFFTPREIASCHNNDNAFVAFAVKYAAKEAVVKAFGESGTALTLREIEIFDDVSGLPKAVVNRQWGQKYFPGQKLTINLSLNHCSNFAIAQATIYAKKLFRGKLLKKFSTPYLCC